jgi:hypothetical protein
MANRKMKPKNIGACTPCPIDNRFDYEFGAVADVGGGAEENRAHGNGVKLGLPPN